MITGKCGNCLTDIVKYDEIRLRPVKAENFSEHWVVLSDGSKMRVGLCKNCKKDIANDKKSDKIRKTIIKNHQDHWKEEIDADPDLFFSKKNKHKDAVDALDITNDGDNEVIVDQKIKNKVK